MKKIFFNPIGSQEGSSHKCTLTSCVYEYRGQTLTFSNNVVTWGIFEFPSLTLACDAVDKSLKPRWRTVIRYACADTRILEHDEMDELQSFVEEGPDFTTVLNIVTTYNK